jgi:AraC-like DNA-binding protein/Tfp pilus assembly protein PilF
MFKKSILTILFLLPFIAYSQAVLSNSSPASDIISGFRQLSVKQLLDTANYYFNKNSTDTALICYSLITNTSIKDTDVKQQKGVLEALNKTAVIYYNLSDYRAACEFWIRALILCEEINDDVYKSRIYSNIGNLYISFYKYDMAKLYCLNALSLCQDSIVMTGIFNNLGVIELKDEKLDTAYYYFSKSLKISRKHNDVYLCNILNNLALLYQLRKQYDSAYYYYRLSLDDAKSNSNIETEAIIYLNLGRLFFEINKIDSALFYIGLSSAMAKENSFLGTLAENYLTLSKVEEARGHKDNAFARFKRYANLKDSIFNVGKFADINQIQRMYEISKTNQQIEQLVIEKQIKERTIYYQQAIQLITLLILVLVSLVLLVIFLQKRKLSTAYTVLFEKNLKIIDLQENLSEQQMEKYKKSALTHDMQDELLDRILMLMENTAVICDTKFTIDKLAELAQSNQTYVSQVINNTLKKNFRSFLNSYRVREAQRIFTAPDAAKYTIEAVALRVGFKSRSAFRDAFKEITGVSPTFYLKSIQKQHSL